MQIQREELIGDLQMVKAGVSPREFIEQSSCVVFQDDHVITFNDEVACRKPTCLKGITGAVQAAALMAILEKLTEPELEVQENEKGELEFRGKKKAFGIVKDAEIFLPIDRVEVPEKWKSLPPEFTEAVGLVQYCVSKDENKFLLTCIHIAPTHIEACQPPGTDVWTEGGCVAIEDIEKGMFVNCYNFQIQAPSRRTIVKHKVTDTSKRDFSGELVRVQAGGNKTKYTPDHHCIVRLGNCFHGKHIVYLQRKGNKFRVGVTGPRKWSKKWNNSQNGFADVRQRMSKQQADCCWILKVCGTQQEALVEERIICSEFGIPDMLFRIRPGEIRSGDQKTCDLFWKRFGDNLERAEKCLTHYRKSILHPFVIRREGGGSRESMTKQMEMKMRACNLEAGMEMLNSDLVWREISVSYETYQGPVYSMTVERSHTYIGDGIVTHNCDNMQIMRFELDTKLKEPVLVRGTSLQQLTSLAMDKISLTESWIHFRNQSGLVYSCRRYVEDYPDLDAILAIKGHPIVIPKGLSEASDRASVFAADKAGDPLMTIKLREGQIRISGEGLTGWYKEVKKAAYHGPPLEFVISPELLKHISDKHSDATINQDKLKVTGGTWSYVTVLGRKKDKEEAEAEEAPKKKRKTAAEDE